MTDPAPPRITLISKPGCHLCVPARAVIDRVARDLGVQWVERSILDDPELSAAYWEQIPVTLVDGVQHDYWRVWGAPPVAGVWCPPRLCVRVHKDLVFGGNHALTVPPCYGGAHIREEPVTS